MSPLTLYVIVSLTLVTAWSGALRIKNVLTFEALRKGIYLLFWEQIRSVFTIVLYLICSCLDCLKANVSIGFIPRGPSISVANQSFCLSFYNIDIPKISDCILLCCGRYPSNSAKQMASSQVISLLRCMWAVCTESLVMGRLLNFETIVFSWPAVERCFMESGSDLDRVSIIAILQFRNAWSSPNWTSVFLVEIGLWTVTCHEASRPTKQDITNWNFILYSVKDPEKWLALSANVDCTARTNLFLFVRHEH